MQCDVIVFVFCWGGWGMHGKARFARFTSKVNAHNGTHTRSHPSSHTPVQYILITQFCCLFQDDLFTGEGRLAKLHAQCQPQYCPPWSAVSFDPSLMLNSCTAEPQCSDDGNSQCRHRRLSAATGHATGIMTSMLLWLTTAPSHPLAAVLKRQAFSDAQKNWRKPTLIFHALSYHHSNHPDGNVHGDGSVCWMTSQFKYETATLANSDLGSCAQSTMV